MPGQTLEIDPQNYPDLAKIEDGEKVSLKVVGTKNTTEEGMIQIETDSIEQVDVNPAKKALKGLKSRMDGGSQEEVGDPGMEEDYA